VPGVRYEYILAEASGKNGVDASGNPIMLQDQQKNRGFFLAGVGAEYHINKQVEAYANITQAYRPMQFADLTAPPTTVEIDPNLSDARGYNADLGIRGRLKNYLFMDLSIFYLQYNNRIGTVTQQRQDGSFYNLTTNVGNSSSKGFEGVVEFSPVKAFAEGKKDYDVSLFTSYAYSDARYGNLVLVSKVGNDLVETNYRNKKVENAPLHVLRAGLSLQYKGLLLTTQLSHTSEVYADANNTVTPSANGQTGLIPAYTVVDMTATYTISGAFNIRAGVNNLGDVAYFTRRAGGYPGPGILPADGRGFFLSFGAKF
jgi:Fe(3+) dicitrate transport protein